jgi:hypothetical protein
MGLLTRGVACGHLPHARGSTLQRRTAVQRGQQRKRVPCHIGLVEPWHGVADTACLRP